MAGRRLFINFARIVIRKTLILRVSAPDSNHQNGHQLTQTKNRR